MDLILTGRPVRGPTRRCKMGAGQPRGGETVRRSAAAIRNSPNSFALFPASLQCAGDRLSSLEQWELSDGRRDQE